MAKHFSLQFRRALYALIALLTASTAAVSQPAPDLAGMWNSNIGLTYTIVQSGTQITWTASDGVQGAVTVGPTGLSSSWSDATGPHTATGQIVEKDGAGRPSRIAWSNGVVFFRLAPPAPTGPPAEVPAQPQGLPNLAGTWGSNIGLTYTISQSGTVASWKASDGIEGRVSFAPTGLVSNWTDVAGPDMATGTIADRDAEGNPTRIVWSNGVIFSRTGTPAVAMPAPTTGAVLVPGAILKVPSATGPLPEISRITPTEPDGKPAVQSGQFFTVFGNNFAANSAATRVGLMRHADPPPPIPPQVQDFIADLPLASGTVNRLDAVMPASVPPGTYLLWVHVDGVGHSKPVSIMVWQPKAVGPIPRITSVDPGYPGTYAVIRGINFAPNTLVEWLTSMQGRVAARFINAAAIEAAVPTDLKPGPVEVAVEVNALRSNWFKTAVLEPKSLSLYAAEGDDNLMWLNPKWGWQLTRKFGAPDYYPDPDKLGRNWATLTDQPVWTETGWFWCGPHVNWGGVTYAGSLKWSSHSAPGTDDDYNFWLFPDEGAGATVRPGNDGGIQLEFDSDETIDQFHTSWWNEFHDAVDHDEAKARQMVDGKYAIASGVMGLDCAHSCGSEVHPVWALAIHVKDDPSDDTWAMFARNWGNEGFCGHNQQVVDFNEVAPGRFEYVFRLPWRPGAAAVQVVAEEFLMRVSTEGPYITPEPGKGVRVAWILPHHSQRDRVNGTLRLKWTSAPTTYSLQTAPAAGTGGSLLAARASGIKDAEEPRILRDVLAKIPADRQSLFHQEYARAMLKAPPTPDLARPTLMTTPVVKTTPARVPIVSAQPDAPTVQRMEALEQTLRQAGIALSVRPMSMSAPGTLQQVTAMQPAAQAAGTTVDISGHWRSSIGLTYEITQQGEAFTWLASQGGEKATGTLRGDSMEARWVGALGPMTAAGRVTSVDQSGRALRIEWSNGVVFVR